MNKLAVYAWSRPGVANFGDELGPDILRRLGHQVVRVPIERAEVITIGSVLELATAAPRGCIIAGAGAMWGGAHPLPAAEHLDIRALRGELTRRALAGGDAEALRDVPLGDPAILAANLYRLAPREARRVGIIPHYIDERAFAFGGQVIDVQRPPAEVIFEISKCSAILSSSLHGLIVAQALGIPAMRLPCAKVRGGDLKWADYTTGLASGELPELAASLLRVLEQL